LAEILIIVAMAKIMMIGGDRDAPAGRQRLLSSRCQPE
jgi:hypothetical protein